MTRLKKRVIYWLSLANERIGKEKRGRERKGATTKSKEMKKKEVKINTKQSEDIEKAEPGVKAKVKLEVESEK